MQDLTQRNRLSAAVVLYHSGVEMLSCIQSFVDSDVYLDLYVVNNSPGDASLLPRAGTAPAFIIIPFGATSAMGAQTILSSPS